MSLLVSISFSLCSTCNFSKLILRANKVDHCHCFSSYWISQKFVLCHSIVKSGHNFQLTKFPLEMICFCVCLQGTGYTCERKWITIYHAVSEFNWREFPHSFWFCYIKCSDCRRPMWKITGHIFLKSSFQAKKENHGSNLMSKFIFTRPVGNIKTVCIQHFLRRTNFLPIFSSLAVFCLWFLDSFFETNEYRSKRFMIRVSRFVLLSSIEFSILFTLKLKGTFLDELRELEDKVF